LDFDCDIAIAIAKLITTMIGMARRMPSSNNEPRQIFSLTVRLYYWCKASRGDIEGLIKERGFMIPRDSMR